MNKNYYDILGVAKSASDADIKKAYKKMAMQYHPDRNKWDKNAEKKFKEINEAYQTLGDASKKKNYDQFGSADWNPFGNGNPFGGWSWRSSWNQWFSGFEDIFSQFGGSKSWRGGSEDFDFDIWDLFGGWTTRSKKSRSPEEESPRQEDNLDITEVIEIPFLDFLYETSVSVKTVYGKILTLKVKAGTKPGTKFKVTGKWRTMNGKTGDMYVIVDAKMPKNIEPNIMKMIDAIRYQL
jgi:molecular chaperone DnaJ